MKEILAKCEYDDFVYLSDVLDSYVSFTDDERRKTLLERSRKSAADREKLISLIDKQIGYYGSSDLAYLTRKIWSGKGAVPSQKIVENVCKKLKLKIKAGGSLESRLERLVTAVVERELLKKSPEELADAFRDIGVGSAETEEILEHIKKDGPVLILPVLVQVLGPKIAIGIIETVIVSMLAQILGRAAAKQLVKEVLKRNPWMNALGPIAWTFSGLWLALDLQGPAYRKTVPICLYLGVVALRDGKEPPLEGL